MTANNNDYYNQTAPLPGHGLDTETNTTILSRGTHNRSENSTQLGPHPATQNALSKVMLLTGAVGVTAVLSYILYYTVLCDVY